MLIQLKSDLHGEFSKKYSKGISDAYLMSNKENQFYVDPKANVLILAGDICTVSDIDYIIKQFENVIIPILYVPGNHEYYGADRLTTDKVFRKELKGTNIKFMNREYEIIGDTVFIVATLWTELTNVFAGIVHRSWSDFTQVKDHKLSYWQSQHLEDVIFIQKALSSEALKGKKKVVVTHHLPSYKSTPEQFKGDPYNPFFFTDLEKIMLDDDAPLVWMHGHTHDSFDYKVGNTRVVCNPYGYFPNALNKQYLNNLLIEV
jgi:Icc-related predicted phosphoesterase